MLKQKNIITVIIIMVFTFLIGCSTPGLISEPTLSGRIFTHIKVPFTKDLNATPSGINQGSGIVVRITEPFTRYRFYTEFNSNAIGDIARHYGLKTVHYATIEYFNILGVWRHQKIFIYGE